MSAEENPSYLDPEELAEVRKFWDDIILNDDDSPCMMNIYAELSDYGKLMEATREVYWTITCGAVSKTTYRASSVLSIYEQCSDFWTRHAICEALNRVKDGEPVDDLLKEYEPDERE